MMNLSREQEEKTHSTIAPLDAYRPAADNILMMQGSVGRHQDDMHTSHSDTVIIVGAINWCILFCSTAKIIPSFSSAMQRQCQLIEASQAEKESECNEEMRAWHLQLPITVGSSSSVWWRLSGRCRTVVTAH